MIPGEGVRLSGGSDLCSGRVEVLRGSAWNTVCDAGFDRQDAEVVCQQLQCGIPQEVLGAACFGKGQGPVWSEEIQCRGNEPGLHVCPTSSREQPSCTHANDVGLVCVGYRLVNGSDSCSGRVELHHEGVWGTVCDLYWDLQDATVLCQQMNCGYAVAVLGQAHFGEGSDTIWADKFSCEGMETHLSKCPISAWRHKPCTHVNDVGIVCSAQAGRVRLAAGPSRCEGRVEVYYNRTWGRVLHDSWGLTEASVVCRELDCGSAMEVSNSSRYGTGDSDVCLTGIRCTGDESHLINCSLPQQVSCNTSNGAAVLCSNHTALRLVEGGGACAGRVEVYHNGSWGTVCDESWDLADAEVVCKQLQCGTALNASVSASFGQGIGPIWLDELRCQGNESTLWECDSGGWGQHNCNHKEDAGVVCSEFKDLRLAEGCSGPIEVLYNGIWRSVCGNRMTQITASVICQQLNCGKSAAIRDAQSRLSSDYKWLDEVNCRRHDSTLWQCPSLPWGQTNCFNYEVAAIECTEASPSRLQPQRDMTIPVIACIVLGALLFVVLVLLAGQLQHNRMLRRGSFLSDELPSDYSDVEDSEGNSIPGESMPSLEGETPGYYDDAVPMNSNPEDLSGEFLQTSPVEEPCTKPSLGERSFHSDELPSGYYDVEDSEGNPIQGFPLTPPGEESARAALPPEEGRAAPDRTDYDDVGEESPGEGGAL
ncbi:UNVERIFIED_CONTAM: hypothetical protein FKN15_014475 [Acipenser sinensis]